MTTPMQTLIFKRGQVKARLTRFRTYLNSPTEIQNKSIEYLQTRLDNAVQLWDRFEQVQAEIEESDTSDEQARERLAFENSYFDTIALAKQTLAQQQLEGITITSNIESHSGSHNNGNGSQHTVSHVKLSTIELPSFGGAHQEWLQFHDMFQSLIHTNQSLSTVQRFHYLKSALKGDAAEVINALMISDSNYEIAWQLLKDRYDNRRLIINNHGAALFELPVVQKESHAALRELVDNTLKHLRALKTLDQPTEYWDTLVIHLVLTKLDYASKREWESSIKQENAPTLDQLMDFLRSKAQVLENIQPTHTTPKQTSTKYSSNKQIQNSTKSSTHTQAHVVTNQMHCLFCKGNHGIYRCSDFLKLSTKDRLNEIKKLKFCINCFKSGHYAPDCNTGSCRVCRKKHNTLLHFEEITTINTTPDQSNTTTSTTTSTHCTQVTTQILLATAIVLLSDRNGKSHEFRALLDSGSQSNFITQEACKRLNLQRTQINIPVIGINQVKTNITAQAEVRIKSKFNSFDERITCLILPRITDNLPNLKLSRAQVTIPENIQLADPDFNISRPIDLLIGAELFWNLSCVEQFKAAKNQPTFQKTHLGWIISGPVQCSRPATTQVNSITNLSVEQQLEKFWAIESIENPSSQSPDELKCEQHFKGDNYS